MGHNDIFYRLQNSSFFVNAMALIKSDYLDTVSLELSCELLTNVKSGLL